MTKRRVVLPPNSTHVIVYRYILMCISTEQYHQPSIMRIYKPLVVLLYLTRTTIAAGGNVFDNAAKKATPKKVTIDDGIPNDTVDVFSPQELEEHLRHAATKNIGEIGGRYPEEVTVDKDMGRRYPPKDLVHMRIMPIKPNNGGPNANLYKGR